MRKLIAIAGLLCSLASAQTTTVVTGLIKDLAQNPVQTGTVTFTETPAADTTISGIARFSNAVISCSINQMAVAANQAVRSANSVTISGLTSHTFIVGDILSVYGMTDSSFNGVSAFTITGTTATSITYAQTAGNATSGGGTVSALRGGINGTSAGSCIVTQNTALTPGGTSYLVTEYPYGTKTAAFTTYALQPTLDLSTVIPTPSTLPIYPGNGFVDVMSTQLVGGTKTFQSIDGLRDAAYNCATPVCDMGAAFNATEAQMTKGIIRIPPPSANWAINTTILINKSNITLWCDGTGNTALVAGSGLGANPVVSFLGTPSARLQNVGMVGCGPVTNGAANNTNYTVGMDGVRVRYVDGWFGDRITTNGIQGPYCVYWRDATNLWLTNSQLKNCTYTQLGIQTDVKQWHILGNTFDTDTCNPANGGNCPQTYMIAEGAEDALGTDFASFGWVQGNKILHNPFWECLDWHGGHDAWWEDNDCEDTAIGAAVQAAAGFVPSQNTMDDDLHILNNKFVLGIPISSAARASNVDTFTFTDPLPALYQPNVIVVIQGVAGGTTAFNGTFLIASVSTNSFTVSQTGSDESANGRTGLVSLGAASTFSIASATRAANVVTFTTSSAVPSGSWVTGATVLVNGVTGGANSFNGTFLVASTPSSTSFTVAQPGGNESANAGTGFTGIITQVNRSCFSAQGNAPITGRRSLNGEFSGNTCVGGGGYFNNLLGALTIYQTKGWKFERNTFRDYWNSCLFLYYFNQDEPFRSNHCVDNQTTVGGVTVSFNSLGSYGITFDDTFLESTYNSPAPQFFARPFVPFVGVQFRNNHIEQQPSTGSYFHPEWLGVEQATLPTYIAGTQGLIGSYGNKYTNAVGQENYTVSAPKTGTASLDSVDAIVQVNTTIGSNVVTIGAGQSILGVTCDYRCIPEGGLISIAGAGPAAGPLNAMVLANTSTTLVLDTAASGTVTNASLTFQLMKLSGPVVSSITSTTANPALTGFMNLASTDTYCWRNNANNADICISKDINDLIHLPGNTSVAGSLFSSLVLGTGGFPCTNGELGLSAGWASTGSATVTAAAGTGQTCSWTITTGTTTAANPTVTDTLTNAMPNNTVVCEMNIHGGTHTAVAGEGFQQTTLSSNAPIFTFNGTPTAGGTTYFVTRRCGP